MLRYFLIGVFLVWSSSLPAKLFDHLKPVGKSEMQSIDGVDYIYMINLDRRPEKYEKSCKILKPYGIIPHRFSAVDGWSLSTEDLWDVAYCFESGDEKGMKGTCYHSDEDGFPVWYHERVYEVSKPYFSHCMSQGAIGIILSHLSVIQDAWDSGYECVWIMEDDITVHSSPLEITEIIEELNAYAPDWVMLFTDLDSKKPDGRWSPCKAIRRRPGVNLEPLSYYLKTKQVSPTLREIRMRFGAYSYLISRHGMKRVLDYYQKHKVFLPYDIDTFYMSNARFFKTSKEIVSTRVGAISDNGQDSRSR